MWWRRLGIRVERIALGRSDQNGSHERFHRDLKAQTTRPPAGTLAAQQRRFDRFACEYNEERPHEALADAVPADRYRPSRRTLPPAAARPLSGPLGTPTRQCRGHGVLARTTLFLNVALAGETVAFDEVDDGVWTLHFGTTPLARWLERERQWQGLRAD